MEPPSQKSQLFQVYLRLRPPPAVNTLYPATATPERFLSVEQPKYEDELPTHITLNPPNDNRRRAVEKFAFTKVFEEDVSQLDIFQGTGVLPLVEGVLGAQGDGRDGLLATLGVTGSGKVCALLFAKDEHVLMHTRPIQYSDPRVSEALLNSRWMSSSAPFPQIY